MFLDSEFLLTELQVLAYFTHTITLPFLYFIEVNSNEELLKIFPRLFTDLKAGGLETLIDYRVEYPHVKASELQVAGDLPKKLLKKSVPMLPLYWNDRLAENMDLVNRLTIQNQERHEYLS